MIRTELLDKLALCAPALAKTEFVPVLSHFCFTGSHVYAYNDQIGVLVPLKTDFKGAVNGEVFLGILRQSRAVNIELAEIEGSLQIKMGAKNATKVKLLLLTPDEFVWEIPKAQPAKEIKVDAKRVKPFLECIESVMHSVSGDTTIPDQLGVTFVGEGKGVALYATDHDSMSYAHFDLKQAWPERVILPSAFCQLLQSICGGRPESFTIEVHDDFVRVVCDGVMIFSRVIESERPFDFKTEFADAFPASAESKTVPIPEKMKLILERACIIADSKEQKVTPTSITAKEDRLTFYCYAKDRGELTDSTSIGEGHPDVKINIEARHLRAVFDAYHSAIDGQENGRLLITSKVMVLTRANMVYLLSSVAAKK